MRTRKPATGLAAIAVGARVELVAVDADLARRLRMAELGLRPGAVLTVLRCTAGGGRLLGIGVSRIAVDGATARRVEVRAA